MITPDHSQRLLNFNRTEGYIVVLAALILGFDLWALLNNISNILMLMGLASVLLLLGIPFVIAVMAARTTRRTMNSTTDVYPLKQYVNLSLRRHAALLTFSAVALIPVCVLFYFYLQMYVDALFSSITSCSEMPCNVPVHLTLPPAFFQHTLGSLTIAVGLWGVNLLACTVAPALALRGQKVGNAVVGTWFVLILVTAAIYQLFVSAEAGHPYQYAVAALLPYGLAYGSTLLLQPRIIDNP